MASTRRQSIVALLLAPVLIGGMPLGLIRPWLPFVPFTVFMLGIVVLAVWSARSAQAPGIADVSPVALYRAVMAAIAAAGLLFAALLSATGLFLRFAPRTPLGSRMHALDVQDITVYVTARQEAAFHAIEIALAVAGAVTLALGIAWRSANRATRRRSGRER